MELNKLVEMAKQGDEAAFQEICKRFTGLVKKLAYQSHLRPIAEEAVSIGFLTIVEGVKEYNASRGIPFEGYIQSKLRFAMWNLFKRERGRWEKECTIEAQQEVEQSLFDRLVAKVDIELEIEHKLLMEELMGWIEVLPKKQRQVVLLTLVLEKGLTETSKLLNVSPQAIFNLRHRGIEKLRNAIQFEEKIDKDGVAVR